MAMPIFLSLKKISAPRRLTIGVLSDWAWARLLARGQVGGDGLHLDEGGGHQKVDDEKKRNIRERPRGISPLRCFFSGCSVFSLY